MSDHEEDFAQEEPVEDDVEEDVDGFIEDNDDDADAEEKVPRTMAPLRTRMVARVF